MSRNGLVYDWKRYWVPRDGVFSYDSDGFLLPPANDSDRLFWPKTDVVGFDALIAKPCLVLLGEPGIGKTFALREAARQATPARSEAKILERNLGNYASDTHLVEDVFNSVEFHWWNAGCGELHVYLDSFDECLVRLDAVASLLGDRFGRLPHVHNLFLCIGSRTAEWRTSLEEALRQKWGQESVGVYELAPLTPGQVLSAAKLHLPDAERFVAEIIAGDVASFAIKPLTLDLLIRIWRKRGGTLPPTQREIYEEGCLELCRENNPDRETPKLRRQFTAEQRMAVASRIAATLMFCRRSAATDGKDIVCWPPEPVSTRPMTLPTGLCASLIWKTEKMRACRYFKNCLSNGNSHWRRRC